MTINRMAAPVDAASNLLGAYLRERRARLDPAEFGLPTARRRTPGLRREEVADRAHISPAWYTWLEQGRGGAPSPVVLDRIADSLRLNQSEREHLFFLALGRAPEVSYRAADAVPARVQRLLDSMETTPAIIKTATWDIVAWNRAAALVMTDYGRLRLDERNLLKLMFRPKSTVVPNADWERIARLVVNSFRADTARNGALAEVDQLVAELSATNAAFHDLWNENDVRLNDDGLVRLDHPLLGRIELEHFHLRVHGRADLSMVVHNPVDPVVTARIRELLRADCH